NQSKLAANVGQAVTGAASPSSYQLTLENEKVAQSADQMVKDLSPVIEGKDDVIGYAFAINGKMNSMDVYASRDLFRKLWPKLLRSSTIEAVAEARKDQKLDTAKAGDVAECVNDAEKAQPSAKDITPRVKLI